MTDLAKWALYWLVAYALGVWLAYRKGRSAGLRLGLERGRAIARGVALNCSMYGACGNEREALIAHGAGMAADEIGKEATRG